MRTVGQLTEIFNILINTIEKETNISIQLHSNVRKVIGSFILFLSSLHFALTGLYISTWKIY